MTRRLLPRVVGGALLALLAPSASAWAAPTADIVSLASDGDTLRVVVQLSDVGPDDTVDPDSVQLTVNGTELEAEARPAGEDTTVDQVAVLVLDTSGSMAGPRLAAAKDAADGFLAAVPDAVKVGLVTFANQARVAVPPTTDHDAVAQAVSDLEAGGSTSLYDAVALAADQLTGADLGTAVVLSDGADEGSQTSLREATRSARDSEAVFDAVAFAGNGSQVSALRAITAATGGTVTSADDAAQLAAAFDEAAQAIADRYVVTATVPAELSGTSATVSVAMTVGGATVLDTAVIPLDVQPTADPQDVQLTPAEAGGPLATFADQYLWLALAAIFVALGILVFVAVSTASRDENVRGSRMRRSLALYTMGSRGPAKERETTVLGDTQVARSAVELAGKVVARRDLESVVGGRLEAAGVPLKSAEWLLIHVGAIVVGGLFFMLLSDFRLLATVLGMVIGFVVPWTYLASKESKRTKAFLAGLPDTLQLIAGSLSAGYSMPQAVDTVVREGRPPISAEFNRALVEARLGVPLEDALDGIAVRMKSKDFSWVVMAIRIQREVGGNLAEVLTTVAATLRERERLRRQVQVLSAEGRLSAWILGLLPVVFALYLVLVRPGYLQPMIESLLGWLMIGTGLLLMAVGALWLRKVVRVEV